MQTAGTDTAHLISLIPSLTYLLFINSFATLTLHPFFSHSPLYSYGFPGFLLAEKTFADAERRVAAQSRQAALSELFFAQVGLHVCLTFA